MFFINLQGWYTHQRLNSPLTQSFLWSEDRIEGKSKQMTVLLNTVRAPRKDVLKFKDTKPES